MTHDFYNRKEIGYYFRRNFNFHKRRELTTNPDFKNLFNSRGFGILLWETREYLLLYKNNYHQLIRYFIRLGLSKEQMLYLLVNLQLTCDKGLFPFLTSPEKEDELNVCLDFISLKCDKLAAQLNTNIYQQCYLFDFFLVKKNLELIPAVFDRIRYLVDIKTDYHQYENFSGLSSPSNFEKLCDNEIKRYLKLLKYEKLQCSSPPPVDILSSGGALKSPEYIGKYIAEKICTIDAAGWRYVFLSEEDYKFLVDLMVKFFTGQQVDIHFKLKLQRNCKTRLCPALNFIYSKFDPSPLKTNHRFLSILQNLSIFENQTFVKIHKDITRFRDIA